MDKLNFSFGFAINPDFYISKYYHNQLSLKRLDYNNIFYIDKLDGDESYSFSITKYFNSIFEKDDLGYIYRGYRIELFKNIDKDLYDTPLKFDIGFIGNTLERSFVLQLGHIFYNDYNAININNIKLFKNYIFDPNNKYFVEGNNTYFRFINKLDKITSIKDKTDPNYSFAYRYIHSFATHIVNTLYTSELYNIIENYEKEYLLIYGKNDKEHTITKYMYEQIFFKTFLNPFIYEVLRC